MKALRNVFAASLRINSPKKDRANVSFFEPNDLKGPSGASLFFIVAILVS